MSRRILAALGAVALSALAFTPATPSSTAGGAVVTGLTTASDAPEEHTQEDLVLESFDGTEIHYTIFRPAGASAENPVPMVFSSHGWGGSRTRNMDYWMDAGFGGLSFDQRGFGQSGDRANVQNPELEAQDVKGLLDVVQGLDWVLRDVDATEDDVFGLDDPTVFAVGGSYGGGFQTVTALTELAESGDTRFDALAPEITWYDLPQALGPQRVARTAWLTLLQGVATMDTAQYIQRAYAYGAGTGQWPDGTIGGVAAPGVPDIDTPFHAHGPAGFVEGSTFVPDGDVRLTIPALWRQGSSDTLFNLNEGVDNLENMAPEAREGSFLIGYNGGHVLPTVAPMGAAVGGDPCSEETEAGSYRDLTRDFFRRVAAGGSTVGFLDHRYGIATMDGGCIWTDDVRTPETVDLGTVVAPTGVGAPLYLPLDVDAEALAGIPTVTATVTTAGLDQRVFLGLAKGDGAGLPTVMQHQMQPLTTVLPRVASEVTIELGGGALHLAEGEELFLVVSPVVDLYATSGSMRTPGALVLEDLIVELPLQ